MSKKILYFGFLLFLFIFLIFLPKKIDSTDSNGVWDCYLVSPTSAPKLPKWYGIKNIKEKCLIDGGEETRKNISKILSGVIFHGSREKNYIALTFDADMTPEMKKSLKEKQIDSWYNKKIIEILEKNEIKATLFLSGMWVETYPNETRKLFENPLFELGNHSYSHPAFEKKCYGLTPIIENDRELQIVKTQKILKEVTGTDNTLFRFPGGCYLESDINAVNKEEMNVIQWDSEGADGFNNNTKLIINNVLKTTQNGSIIVLHLHGGYFAPKTADALPEIISELKKRGFIFVKVTELINFM